MKQKSNKLKQFKKTLNKILKKNLKLLFKKKLKKNLKNLQFLSKLKLL
jgi:hypothetical protein